MVQATAEQIRIAELERHIRELVSANEKAKQKQAKLKTQRTELNYELQFKQEEIAHLQNQLTEQKKKVEAYLGHDDKTGKARPTSRHNLRVHINEITLEKLEDKLANYQQISEEEKDKALLEAYRKFEEVG